MSVKEYTGYHTWKEAWDITDLTLSEVVAWAESKGLDPSEYYIQYVGCGSHEIVLSSDDPEEK